MRRSMLVNLVLLLLVTLWGTGVTRALHERFDHPAHGSAIADMHDAHESTTPDDPHGHSHGTAPAGCETCVALASLGMIVVAILAIAWRGRACRPFFRPVAQRARSLDWLPALSNRGPPAALAA